MKSPKIFIPILFLFVTGYFELFSQSKQDTCILDNAELNLEDRFMNLQNQQIEKGCLDSLTFRYNGVWVTYGVVEVEGRYWLDRNLGAKRVPHDMLDKQGFGHYFQWGREADGHQLKDTICDVQITLKNSQPGHGMFIKGDFILSDWTKCYDWGERWIDKNGIKTNTDVCPDGWHIPKATEWSVLTLNIKSAKEAFRSKLMLPLTGDTHPTENIHAIYWSSSYTKNKLGKTSGIAFYFNTFNRCEMDYSYGPANGASIRCIKDSGN